MQTPSSWILKFWSADGSRCEIQKWTVERYLKQQVASFVEKGIRFEVEALSR